ncbi:MAG: CehA/McbA family metallohydrolase, partial [Chloroflexi bacterium]|nr:CehA/McbA family metallohydrolase [Chloroflexota bacterium]
PPAGPLPEATLSGHSEHLGTCILDVQFTGYGLEEGDVVQVLLGTPESYPVIAPVHPMTYWLVTAVDAQGSGEYRRIAQSPTLKVVGGPAARFQVTAPAVVAPGQPFQVMATAIDAYNENPASGYRGDAALATQEGSAQVEPRPEACPGPHRRFQAQSSGPALLRFTAVDQQNGLAGSSHYISSGSFDPSVAGLGLFFGDIHTHGYNCDGIGTIEDAYRWAREARALDFVARTNHAEGAKRRCVADFWPEVIQAAQQWYQPGRFVPFLAFEWGGWDLFGDKCVYYRDAEGPILSASDPRSNTPDRLWQALGQRQALTIPHHPMYGGHTDWRYHDPRFQRLVEVYSTWGPSEAGGETSVQAAWARGLRLGVIASSDEHRGQPGNPWGGLACVWAPELTREALFDALWSRRCYGTTGARILVAFSVNGLPMGQELTAAPGAKLMLRARVAGASPIRELALVRDNEDTWVYRDLGHVAEVEVSTHAPQRGGAFYYLRVTQSDRQMAWSSPVWVDVADRGEQQGAAARPAAAADSE